MIAVLAVTRFVQEIIQNSGTRQGDVEVVASFRMFLTDFSYHGNENLDEHKIDYTEVLYACSRYPRFWNDTIFL